MQANMANEGLSHSSGPLAGNISDWQERLGLIVDMIREMSRQSDPQELIRLATAKMETLYSSECYVSLSRRGLQAPTYRVTRASFWEEDINPWKEKHRLPLLSGGLLAELLYGDQPRLINDVRLEPDDPAGPYINGHRSLMAIPVFENNAGLNMRVAMRKAQNAFDPQSLPEWTLITNLFGRATQKMVLSEQVRAAYDELDRELKTVSDIQESLLPRSVPRVENLDIATYYKTSRYAGGDYYDFSLIPTASWAFLSPM